ncbi:MAG: hypothetical protein ACO3G4_15025 [Opitutaceae bacterium]
MTLAFPFLHRARRALAVLLALLAFSALAAPATPTTPPAPLVPAGVARLDITPEVPIRLTGYQARATEAPRIGAPLHARALALGGDAEGPVVLITAELIGIGEETARIVAEALEHRFGVPRARLAVCATHTHNGPALADVLPNMFARDLPPEETARIAAYTARLRERLVEVAAAALADRRPARIAWAEGRVGFATQRRQVVDGKWKGFGIVPGGPVDHALPVLRVSEPDGGIRALFVNYACHCTTLGGADNFVHSDWAGDAASRLEAAHPGAPALVAIGCGADANPGLPRGPEGVPVHGAAVAAEVARLLGGAWRPLGPVTAAAYRVVSLPLDPRPDRAALEARRGPGSRAPAQYAAGRFLADLAAGRPLPDAVPLPVQAWAFGRELAMVFLGGEVVAEYALRLRRELDGPRLWVNAYANAVPCYVPSRRMYPEGGYEVDGSMDYYGWPARLHPDTEERLIAAVRGIVPWEFAVARP